MKVLSCSLFVWPVERRQTRKPTQTNTWTLAFFCPGPVSIETLGAVWWNILEFRSSVVQHNLSVFLFGWWLLYSVTRCIIQVWAVGCIWNDLKVNPKKNIVWFKSGRPDRSDRRFGTFACWGAARDLAWSQGQWLVDWKCLAKHTDFVPSLLWFWFYFRRLCLNSSFHKED